MKLLSQLAMVSTLAVFTLSASAENVDSSTDRIALEAIFHATNGSEWQNSQGWLSEEPIGNWFGVVTRNNRVVRLDLADNHLTGTIPGELSDLAELRLLDLRWNAISDELPDLSSLVNLRSLLLTANQLKGTVPEWIGNLYKLERLDLSHNEFEGSIPPAIGKISSLQSFAAHHNNLSGSIPAEFGNSGSLVRLVLNNNRLEGTIPSDWQNLSSLRHLNLSHNLLEGDIPYWIGESRTLEWLDLRWNTLTGLRQEVFFISLLGDTQRFSSKTTQLSAGRAINGLDHWGQSSEVLENPRVRRLIVRYLAELSVEDGLLAIDKDDIPIGVDYVPQSIAWVNDKLKDTNTTIATTSDLSRWLTATHKRLVQRMQEYGAYQIDDEWGELEADENGDFSIEVQFNSTQFDEEGEQIPRFELILPSDQSLLPAMYDVNSTNFRYINGQTTTTFEGPGGVSFTVTVHAATPVNLGSNQLKAVGTYSFGGGTCKNTTMHLEVGLYVANGSGGGAAGERLSYLPKPGHPCNQGIQLTAIGMITKHGFYFTKMTATPEQPNFRPLFVTAISGTLEADQDWH